MSPALVACVYKVMVLGSVNSRFWLFHSFMLVLTLVSWPFSCDWSPEICLDEPSCWGCEICEINTHGETAGPDVGTITRGYCIYNTASFSSCVLLLNCVKCVKWIAIGWIVMTVGRNINYLQKMSYIIIDPLTFHIAIIRSKVLCLMTKYMQN